MTSKPETKFGHRLKHLNWTRLQFLDLCVVMNSPNCSATSGAVVKGCNSFFCSQSFILNNLMFTFNDGRHAQYSRVLL